MIHSCLFQGMLNSSLLLALSKPTQPARPWGLKEAKLHPLRAELNGGTDTDLKGTFVCVNREVGGGDRNTSTQYCFLGPLLYQSSLRAQIFFCPAPPPSSPDYRVVCLVETS